MLDPKLEEEAVADLQEIEEGERCALWQTVNDMYFTAVNELTALEYFEEAPWKTGDFRFTLGVIVEQAHRFYDLALKRGWAKPAKGETWEEKNNR